MKPQKEALDVAMQSKAVKVCITTAKHKAVKSGAYHLLDGSLCEYGQGIPATEFVWAWNYTHREPQLLFVRNVEHVEKVPLQPEDFKWATENVGPDNYRKMMGIASIGHAEQFERWEMPSKQRDTSSEDFLTGVKANIKQMLINYLRRR